LDTTDSKYKTRLEFIVDAAALGLGEYEHSLDEEGRPTNRVAISSYDEEHINFVTAIRNNTQLKHIENLASATLVGVSGRREPLI
jgi:hypothetical protein